MRSTDNDLATDKHEATFNLVAHKKYTFGKHYAEHWSSQCGKGVSCCLHLRQKKKHLRQGESKGSSDFIRSCIFTHTAQNLVYCPYRTRPAVIVVAIVVLLHAYHCCVSACWRLAARTLHVCVDVTSKVNMSLQHRCPGVDRIQKTRIIVCIVLF